MAITDFCGPLWAEGLFLTPQHFQHFERNREITDWTRHSLLNTYPWGVSEIDIEHSALNAYQFVLQKFEGVMPGGLVLRMPGNLSCPSRSFDQALTDPAKRLVIYLGVADLLPDQPNLSDGESGNTPRYTGDEIELPDENTGKFQQKIRVKRVVGRIFFEGEDTSGYQVMPLAQVKIAPTSDGAVLCDDFISPTLRIGSVLQLRNIAQSITTALGASVNNLASGFENRTFTELLGLPRGTEMALKLMALNRNYQVIRQETRAGLLHPFAFYLELLRLCGELWVFKGNETIAPPPPYDHSNLGHCFQEMVRVIERLLTCMPIIYYEQRSFVPSGDHLEVTLEPDWISNHRSFYIRINEISDFQEAVNTMVNAKLCAPADLPGIIQRRLKALPVTWLQTAPKVLPASGVYGKIETTDSHFDAVRGQLRLALGGMDDGPYSFELFVV